MCVLLGVLVSSFRLTHLVFGKLRDDHPVSWVELGELESVFVRRSTYWELDKFCLSGRYLELGYARLTKLCNWLVVCRAILYIAALLGLAYHLAAGADQKRNDAGHVYSCAGRCGPVRYSPGSSSSAGSSLT
jgi:hypothetical protein